MNTRPTILQVAMPVPLRRLFDYRSNDNEPIATVGSRVEAPFGRQCLVGIVMAVKDYSTVPKHKLKKIYRCLDQEPLLPSNLLTLCQWASDYYHYPLGEVIATALPRKLRQGKPAYLTREQGWKLNTQTSEITHDQLRRAPKQWSAVVLLKENPQGLSVKQLAAENISKTVLDALCHKQMITEIDMPKVPLGVSPTTLVLNIAQLDAINAIVNSLGTFHTFLLEGITGSGKTEVYLQAIAAALHQDRSALVLVPEIGLTPQTIARFQRRFGEGVVVLHSQLNDSDRLKHWLMAKEGEVKIVIGTRSAIFTPIKNLGLIIVDESHDLSYKQQDGFRYSARDIAIRYAQMNRIPVVLGSATPSLESLFNAKNHRYQLLHLPERAGNAVIPQLHLIDIQDQKLEGGLSPHMIKSIDQHLQKQQQVLLFLNRRGFAPTIMCRQCNWIADCERCHTHLVFHQALNYLHCHHCGKTQAYPPHCLSCHSNTLQAIGVGTERLEVTLKDRFPQHKITRIDRDTTRSKTQLHHLLNMIHEGEPQILIGTQMLAKGHHFPKVTMVGVINADSGFFSADFRAVERTGQLLIQVAGRAGRGDQAGEVFIQTQQPHHPLLQSLVNEGYRAFSHHILQQRRDCHLPPFSYLALFRAETNQEKMAEHFLQQVKQYASALNSQQQLQILGPIVAPMPKRAGHYRYQLLIKSEQRQALQQLLNALMPKIENMKLIRKVRWSLDIDPLEMF